MSTSAIIIEGTSADDVVLHLWRRSPQVRELAVRCSYDYASSPLVKPRAAIADVASGDERWTELWDPDHEGLLRPPLDLPLGTRAFAFVFRPAERAYGFGYWVDGALERSAYGANAAWDELRILELMASLGFAFRHAASAHRGTRYRILERRPDGSQIPEWAIDDGRRAPHASPPSHATHASSHARASGAALLDGGRRRRAAFGIERA